MKTIWPLIIILFLFSLPSKAGDENRQYWSQSVATCGEWSQERKADSQKSELYKAWITGYLSSYNAWTDGVFNILGVADMKNIYSWMDKYCSENRLDFVATGMMDLIAILWPYRIIDGPQPTPE